MKLTDITCKECGFDKWDIELEYPVRHTTAICPNCESAIYITMGIFKTKIDKEE